MITVVDVMRDLGLEVTPSLSWSIGAAVRALYEERYGALPDKALRAKTNGAGSHCFAVYPEHMRADIVAIVRRHKVESDRQLRMF